MAKIKIQFSKEERVLICIAFLHVLCLVLWLGGLTLMEFFSLPSYDFWYKVSLAGLCCIPLTSYLFIYEFFSIEKTKEKELVKILSLLMVISGCLGLYVGAGVFIPIGLSSIILSFIIRIGRACKDIKDFPIVLAGIVVLLAGNILSIIPGNIIPFDIIGGVINVGLMSLAIYRRGFVTNMLEPCDGSDCREDDYVSNIYTITAAIDAKDHYTFGHSKNVAGYAKVLASAIGLDENNIRLIYQAGLVHDVGKLAIPETILSKPGPLTEEEYKIMQGHVERGAGIIGKFPSLNYVVPVALTHHERWDGKGYPRGLKGEEIQMGGRCLALADAFDAMTTCRSYKKAYSVDFALQQIKECSGSQFDPNLSEVFIHLVEDGTIRTA